MNGSDEVSNFKVAKENVNKMYVDAGFYTFELDEHGYAVNLVPTGLYWLTSNDDFYADIDLSDIHIGDRDVAEDVVVVDIRNDKGDVDTIEEFVDFVNNNFNDMAAEVKIAYTLNGSGDVNVIYVLDNTDVDWEVTVAATKTIEYSADNKIEYTTNFGTINGTAVQSVMANKYSDEVTLYVSRSTAYAGPIVAVDYQIDGTGATLTAYSAPVDDESTTVAVTIPVSGSCEIVVTGVRGVEGTTATPIE